MFHYAAVNIEHAQLFLTEDCDLFFVSVMCVTVNEKAAVVFSEHDSQSGGLGRVAGSLAGMGTSKQTCSI